MGSYTPKLVLRRTFVHDDGRKVLAFKDGDDGWIVELRYPSVEAGRPRWYPTTETAAVQTCWAIMKDEAGWEEA